MASIAKDSTSYREVRPLAFQHEDNDCVVRAFAITLNKSYAEIHEACEVFGRKPKHGTIKKTQRDVACLFDMQAITFKELMEINPKYPTVGQFIQRFPKGRFYVTKDGHAFSIIDGIVYDWRTSSGPKTKIRTAFQVLS